MSSQMINSSSVDGEEDLGEEDADDEIANASTLAMSRAETPNAPAATCTRPQAVAPAAGKRSGGNIEKLWAGRDREQSGGDKK